MKYFFILLVLLVVEPVYTAGKNVTGIVFNDKNKNGIYDAGDIVMPDVCVSNQREVVKTDAQGRYQLPLRKNAFIYVVKPQGYALQLDEDNIPQGNYYHHPKGTPRNLKYPGVEPTAKQPVEINFPLYATGLKTNFRMLALGDPQMPNDEALDYFRDGAVADLFRHQADFYMVHGDIADDHLLIYPREKKIMGKLNVPGYHVPGNHDVNYRSEDRVNDFETYRMAYGPDYYAFNYGNVHFIVLNNIAYQGWDKLNNKAGRYTGNLDDTQLEWLQNDLATVPHNRLIVINSHIPFLEGPAQKEAVVKLHQMLSDRQAVLSLSGHTHQVNTYRLDENSHWPYPGMHEGVILGATCGSWWSNPKDENGIPVATCNDGSPRGYFVFDFMGVDYSYRFIPFHYRDDFQMRVSLPQGRLQQSELADTDIVVNWFVGKPQQKVEVRINGGAVRLMENFYGTDPFYEGTLDIRKTDPAYPPRARETQHLWKVALPVDLPVGTHHIEVTAYGDKGKTYQAIKLFAVE
ncbi:MULTISPECIES: calcineurin-like phosphoesterase C-terminal domain-containing protein [unclassified Carboxylicivirga]|uniref:calcineurin-like phosphoesterase C-terminal domain-containing protein n=1 Tax=Carboxylicivirga TaxID=1628153 RepID=UPI003D33C0F2